MKVLLFLFLASRVCCETTQENGNQTPDYSEDSSVTPTPEYEDYDYDYNATFEADNVSSTVEPQQSATMWSEEDQTSVTPTPDYDEYDYTIDYEYVTVKESRKLGTIVKSGQTTQENGNQTPDYSEDSSVTPTPEYEEYDYDYNATFEADNVSSTVEPQQSATMWSEEDQTSVTPTPDYDEYDYTIDHEYETVKESRKLGTIMKSGHTQQDPEPPFDCCGSLTDHRSILKALLMSLPALLSERVMTFLQSG